MAHKCNCSSDKKAFTCGCSPVHTNLATFKAQLAEYSDKVQYLPDTVLARAFSVAYASQPQQAVDRLRLILPPHRLLTVIELATNHMSEEATSDLATCFPELSEPATGFVECMVWNGHEGKLELTKVEWK